MVTCNVIADFPLGVLDCIIVQLAEFHLMCATEMHIPQSGIGGVSESSRKLTVLQYLTIIFTLRNYNFIYITRTMITNVITGCAS